MALVFLRIMALWACLWVPWPGAATTRNRWLSTFHEGVGSTTWHNHPHQPVISNDPCRLCPSNVTLIARKGSNCALIRVPVVHSCPHTAEPLGIEAIHQPVTGSALETEIVRGLRPGSWATEGTHRMVVRVSDHGHPVGICRIQQQVQVRRCAPLASRNGLEVNCTRDRTWGSKCSFRCSRGLVLDGVQEIACEGGGDSPRWTHPPPFCTESVLDTCPLLEAPLYGTVQCATSNRTCTFGCQEGYAIPRSQRVYVSWTCEHGEWKQSSIPQCIRKIPPEAPEEDCMNVTLILPRSGQSLALPLPKFVAVSGTTIVSQCNVNEFAQAGVIQRDCVGIDNELGNRGYCNYTVTVLESKCPELRSPANGNLECGWHNFTLRCNLTCHAGFVLMHDFAHLQTFNGVTECDPAFGYWDFQQGDSTLSLPDCEEPAPKMRFMAELRFNVSVDSCDTHHVAHIRQVAQQALMIRNQDVCQEANCTQFETVCQEHQSGFDLEIIWTVTASYTPIVDYYYDDAHVPEGEALIEKLQVATENMLKYDRNFAQVLRTMGVELKSQTFRVSMLDLVCDTPGYIVDEVTNKCRKCPAHTYQHKAQCLACPEGTRQDRPGQSSCKTCANPDCTSVQPTKSNLDPGLGSVAAVQRPEFTINSFETVELSSKSPNAKKKKVAKPTEAANINSLSTATIKPPNKLERSGISTKPKIRPGRPLRDEPYRTSRPASVPKSSKHSSKPSKKKAQHGHRNLRYRLIDGTPVAEKMPDEDPCQPNPCLVGGTCTVKKGEPFCICPMGYTGLHCEKPRCTSLHCFYGGTCALKHGQPVCICPQGRSGSRCEFASKSRAGKRPKKHSKKVRGNDFGFCTSNPCLNGGRCVDNSQAGFYTCKCVGKYIGNDCQFLPCPSVLHRMFCLNGGQCATDPTTSVRRCICPDSFSGLRCEKLSLSCSNSLSIPSNRC